MCSETGLVLREDSTEVLTYIDKSDKVSVRKKHLGLARWEVEECCKDKEQPEGRLWGRKIFTKQKASQCDWDTQNKGGWCQVDATFYKVFGFRTLFQKLLEVTEESAGGKLDARFLFQSSICCVWKLLFTCLLMPHSLQPHWWQPTSSTAHGILQARTLDWVAISFSKELPFDSFRNDTHIFLLFMCISGSLGH